MKRYLTYFVIVLSSVMGIAAQVDGDQKKLEKLSVDDLVAKHRASVGAAEALGRSQPRVMVGRGVFTAKNTAGKVGGPAQLATSGDKFLFALLMNANNYPYEKLAFDGKELTTGVLPGGGISPLGDFLKSHKLILKRGLLGGVLSQGWPLLGSNSDVRLESGGIAKIDGRDLYKLKLLSSGQGEMTVSLYLEPATFRHVRTEYFYRTGQLTTPNPNRPGQIDGTSPRNYSLVEEFSNFAKVDDLVLPLGYVIEYTTDAGRTLTWTINFQQVVNQPIEASAFRVS